MQNFTDIEIEAMAREIVREKYPEIDPMFAQMFDVDASKPQDDEWVYYIDEARERLAKNEITRLQNLVDNYVLEQGVGQQQLDELVNENSRLRAAAQAVIDQWDTPNWKLREATAEIIGRLREELRKS